MKLIISLGSSALFLLPILLLSSCGGSKTELPPNTNPSLVTSEVINGIAVPPEPDPIKNNATLAGIDSNNNGVRDDVERKIAAIIKIPADYSVAISYAKAHEKIIVLNISTREEAIKLLSEEMCTVNGASNDILTLPLNKFELNSDERKKALAKFNRIVSGLDPEELLKCK